VLASYLLGFDPPRLPATRLVALAELFGFTENTTRVALSRMVATGEATNDEGVYALAGSLAERHRRQRKSVAHRPAPRQAWRGGWTMAVVTAERRTAAERSRFRAEARASRFAELRDGVWMRPDRLTDGTPVTHPFGDDPSVRVILAGPIDGAAALAAQLWDLDAWATTARHLLVSLEHQQTSSTSDIAPGFVLSADVIRHLQSDPLLPQALLPADWPGDDLRRRHRDWSRKYAQLLATWHGLGSG
jgi:phenylacetic acid degradation operon negative regulatory protein